MFDLCSKILFMSYYIAHAYNYPYSSFMSYLYLINCNYPYLSFLTAALSVVITGYLFLLFRSFVTLVIVIL